MSDQQYEQGSSEVDADYSDGYSAGSMLRIAREARGESMADVAHALKLAPRQVEAMELNRFDLLPGAAFVRGFLRNYARYLGVDAEAVLAALSHEVAQQKVELAPVSNVNAAMPDGNGEQRVLKPAAIIIWGLLLALGMGWYFDWFKIAQSPPVVSRSEISPLHDTPMPPELLSDKPGSDEIVRESADTPQVAEPTSAEAPREVGVAPQAAVEAVAGSGPVAAAAPQVVRSAAEAKPPVQLTTKPVQATEAAPVAASEAVAPPAVVEEALPEGLSRLVFKLDGEAWIQVRDTDDVTLYSGVAAAGTTRTVQGKAPFALVIGNAAKVVLEHDGKAVDLTPHIRSGGVARVKLEQTGQ